MTQPVGRAPLPSPDPRLTAVAASMLPSGATVTTPSHAVANALAAAGVRAVRGALPAGENEPWDAVVLLDDELSLAGEDGEALIAQASEALRPGGLLVVDAIGAMVALARGTPLGSARAYSSEELTRALGHRGFTVELLLAPGAAAALAGDGSGAVDLRRDRAPGLLDAAERLFAVGRKGASPAARSEAFFSTLPRKVVAAAVLCRDDEGRVLVVHDSFKQHWTIPGGVVDPGEDPRTGAVREAWEEAGTRVSAGNVLGVFAASWPERVVLVYAAFPAGPAPASARARHAHEIDAVAWVPLREALARLAPHVAEQVHHCLEQPGGTWFQSGGA